MALQFVLGSSGSGKTVWIYNELIKRSLENQQTPLLLIVPEQFTLQTQQDLLQLHERFGIMNIEVLSFQRLAYRIFDDLFLADRALLKETGKSMVIRKLVEASKEKYAMLHPNIHRKGYIKELKGLITEFYQYNFGEETFDKIENEIKSPLLKEKMRDTRSLFTDFKTFLSDQYLTNENTLDLLIEGIDRNVWLKDARIYLDGFYGFTPIQYQILQKLLKNARNVHVAITLDSREHSEDMEEDCQLFYESKKMINQLKLIVEKEKLSLGETVQIEDEFPKRYENSKEIAHLEKNLYRYPYKVYEEKPHDILMCQASNIRKEVVYVADSIMKLVMTKGYRFKDIAVLTGDLSGYEHQIKQVFERYDIPLFIDHKKGIVDHPVVEIIVAALEIISKDFSYESMFRYIKSGLLDLNEETVDYIENYALAYGIRGFKAWQSDWDRPYPLLRLEKDSKYLEALLQAMNETKGKILEPLIELRTYLRQKEGTVETKTKTLYTFLKAINLEGKVDKFVEQFEEQGALLYQKEYEQIYKMVIDVLEQMVEILGNQVITLKDYLVLLQAGFEECEMGLVPPSMDQVVIGDLERTRTREVQALFVVGFNEGKVPKVLEQGKILTDYERLQIKELGIAVAPDNKENIFKEQFSLYMGLLRVRKKLYLSYSKSDLQGKPMRPSLLFYTIKKMFSEMTVLDLDELYENRSIVNKPKPSFQQLISRLHLTQEKNLYAEHKEIYQWFYHQQAWQVRVLATHQALSFKNVEPDLGMQAVEALYGKELKNSVSRLEAFAKCPFSHFIDYGLHLNERLDYTVKMPDIGILFHKAIDLCSRKIDQSGLGWKTLGDGLRDELVEQSVLEVIGQEQRGIFIHSARSSYLIKRLTRITKRAVWAISQQISKGDFKPIDYEYAFDASKETVKALTIDFDDERAMHLSGRIDRVDAYREEEALYLSVIDYKSGNQKFDLVALYYGLQLQLLVYLNAVTELKKNTQGDSDSKVVPAGVFYFHIDDPIIKDASVRNSKVIEAMILKELKLKGLVLDQQNIIKKMDASFEKTSDIIPVSLTSQGELSKTSSVASMDQFIELQSFVDQKIKEIGFSIVQGALSAHPYKRKTETGCDYCAYLSICRFEQGINNYRVLKELSKAELWDNMKQQNNKDTIS